MEKCKNWSNKCIPDEFTNVVIKPLNTRYQAQPIISDWVTIASMQIYARATLTINVNGILEIDGEHTYSTGLETLEGNVLNQGKIIINNTGTPPNQAILAKIQGNGKLFINNQNVGENYLAQSDTQLNMVNSQETKKSLRSNKKHTSLDITLLRPLFFPTRSYNRHCENAWLAFL